MGLGDLYDLFNMAGAAADMHRKDGVRMMMSESISTCVGCHGNQTRTGGYYQENMPERA